MTKLHIIAMSIGMVAFLGLSPAVIAQPKLTPQEEWEAHPNLAKAVRSMEGAITDLNKAPHDFDGNRVKAIADLKQGIHSLKKAIFYRLHMDDAAIDAAQVH
jgi:hypothetical protein